MKNQVVAFLCCVVLLAAAAYGQTGVGQIQGTVRDATGSVIVKVIVDLENVQAGSRSRTTTSEAGIFVFPSLRTGEYRLNVSAAGMEAWQGRVELQVGQAAVVNVTLNVAAVATQMTVAGDVTPLVTTTSPTIATVLERARIEQLPLNGRSVTALMALTVPGLEGSSTQPQVYGLRDSSMEFLQDGVVMNDRNTGDIQSRPPGLDTVQEFRVETSSSSAKFNQPATFVASTRSGTNKWHGAVFETMRNSGFGVARRREESFAKAPHLVRNEFGASLGGPLTIPKVYHGKNRTFFFVAWEESLNRSANSFTSYVWTAASRQGDFSGLTDSAGRKITLYDPWSVGPGPTYQKVPYVGNQLPIGKLSPLSQYVYSVTPLPTRPEVNPNVTYNFAGLSPVRTNQGTVTVRVDHRIGDRDQIFGRFTDGNYDQLQRRSNNGSVVTTDGLWAREQYYSPSNSGMTSWNHIFSTRFFVETTGTVTRNDWEYSMHLPSATENIAAQLKVPNPFGTYGAPTLQNFVYGGVAFPGVVPRSQYTRIYSGEQNYTLIARTHQLEFGWRYRNEGLDTIPDRPQQGTIDFSSAATALYNPATGNSFGTQPQTGDNAANFFLGVAASYNNIHPTGRYNMRSKDISAYFQDNWKVRSNLTLNLGLRYEYMGPYVDRDGVTQSFDFPSKTLVNRQTIDQLIAHDYTTQAIAQAYKNLGIKWSTPTQVGLPENLISVGKRDFSPRAGIAYHSKLGGRTVVLRGGYGVYHFPLPARTFNPIRLTPPLQGTYNFSWNTGTNAPDGLPFYFLRQPPTVVAGANSEGVFNGYSAPNLAPGISIDSLATYLPTSMAHEWNATLETQLNTSTVVRIGLVGTAGRHMEMNNTFNQNPVTNYVWYTTSGLSLPTGTYSSTARRTYDQTTYGDIRVYSKIGFSNFSGVKLEAERRYSHGLAFQLFYVLSNSASSGSVPSLGGDNTTNSAPQAEIFLPGAMPESLDARIRLYRYTRDTAIPQHRIRGNSLIDLPFGRGKKWMSGAGPMMNRLVGGWQIAASGNAQSRWFSLPANNWGAFNKVETYGTQYSIQDCRSGLCIRGFLYYNGYIPANQINAANGLLGVPESYTAANPPIWPTPANGGSPTDPNRQYYETNNVFVKLKNGSSVLVSQDSGLNPYRNQAVHGPWLSSMSASLFKNVRIVERLNLRFSLDSFNTLNQPGLPMPNSNTGILSLQTSGQGARVLQWTSRLTW